MNEVTPLLVEQANDIVRDAKEIVKGDVYLDRIKEFVPAGNNPVYPDVLVKVRVVRESLDRCETELGTQNRRLQVKLRRARTVVGSLECFMSGQEGSESALKDDVQAYVEGDVDDSCFLSEEETNLEYFDFETLDNQTLEEYLSIATKDESSEDEEEGSGLDIDETLKNLGEEPDEKE